MAARISASAALDRYQHQVDPFNAAHPVGSPILVWVGHYRDGQPVSAEVAAPARCAGFAEPMVLVRDHGWIALTHVFHGRGRPYRTELFLDARRIEAVCEPLRIDPVDAERLRAAASPRGVTAGELARRIVEAVVRDGLIDAVLDDRAEIAARRRYGEAA